MDAKRMRLTPLGIAGLFLASRLMLLAGLPLNGLTGYSDLHHFYELARLPGLPFIHYWVEFPPVFPFVAKLMFLLSSGRESTFATMAAMVFSLALAASVFCFSKLDLLVNQREAPGAATFVFAAILAGLPYGWWFFDPLALLAMLWGVWLILKDRSAAGGIVLGLGALVKWFPLLALVVAWRGRSTKRAIMASASALAVILIVLGGLYLTAPEMTAASLRSQLSKGSWETVWALVDGNMGTGNFGPESERADPQLAAQPMGNPGRMPSWLTLIPFAGLGLVALVKIPRGGAREHVAFLGVTWALFLLWSPGWSPQWVLYLLPLMLLVFPLSRGVLLSLALAIVSLLEWPILLSRGDFESLYLIVPVRTMMVAAMGVLMAFPLLGEGRARSAR